MGFSERYGIYFSAVGVLVYWWVPAQVLLDDAFFAITWSLWLVRNELIFRNKDPDYDVFFYILTRLCTWINVLMPEFTYNALDLLISAEGITKWSNSKIPRPQVS